MTQQPEFIFDVAQGDVGLSRRLRQSLELIRSWPSTARSDMGAKIDDILAGRISLREFGTSELFAELVDLVPAEKIDEFLERPENDHEELARLGQADLERLRNRPPEENIATEQHSSSSHSPGPLPNRQVGSDHVIPGTRKPNRERIVTPDDPDEDDAYFEQRHRSGWLQ